MDNNITGEAWNLLYAGRGIEDTTNIAWKRVTVIESADGTKDEYVLPIVPQNQGCILLFKNGIGTDMFTYNSLTNSVIFTEGNVTLGVKITAFILEKE